MFKIPKTLPISLMFLLSVSTIYTQEDVSNWLSKVVKKQRSQFSETNTSSYALFSPASKKSLQGRGLEMKAGVDIFNIERQLISNILHDQNPLLDLEIPFGGKTLMLELIKQDPQTSDFKLRTSDGSNYYQKLAAHYRGYVRGDEQSIAAISLFQHEISGLIITKDQGNIAISSLSKSADLHIIHQEDNQNLEDPLNCEALLPPGAAWKIQPTNTTERSTSEVNCVQIDFETSYSLFENLGREVDQVTNYILGVFNQVAAIYTNEQINLQLSDLYVWTEPDPYDHSTTAGALETFMNTSAKGRGQLRHLIDMVDNKNGGRAYINVICDPVFNVGYSNILPTYSRVPQYSWTVHVLAHELGHGLGSFHTQDCVWGQDSCSAIDGCGVPNPNLGCATCPGAPIPERGTIMSYCHLEKGIDFTLGLGQQPGDLIRSRISAAKCLSSCGIESGEVPCTLSISNVVITDATCDQENGMLTIEISGGTGTESFDIGYGPQPGHLFTGLAPGDYTIHVSGGIGCQRSTKASIVNSSSKPLMNITVTNASCAGDDGLIELSVSGGKNPYQYQLEDSIFTDSQLSGLSAGIYQIAVKSLDGCQTSQQVQIFEDVPPSLEPVVESTKCGLENGRIKLTGRGGSKPYSFRIEGQFDTGDDFEQSIHTASPVFLENLAPGLYQVKLTDANACQDSLVVVIEPSILPNMRVTSSPASCGKANGSINVEIDGGSGPYTYLINDWISTNDKIMDLDSGQYTIVVRDDDDHCEISDTITVAYDFRRIPPQLPGTVHLCEGQQVQISTSLPADTKVIWRKEEELLPITSHETWVTQPGIYEVTAIYSDQCQLSAQTEVIQQELPGQPMKVMDTVCFGDSPMIETLDPSDRYSWSYESSGIITKFQHSGTYELEVVGDHGCGRKLPYEIIVIDPIKLVSSQMIYDICPGEEIQLYVGGADDYFWSTEDQTLNEFDRPDPFVAPQSHSSYQVVGSNRCFSDTLWLEVAVQHNLISLPRDTLLVAGRDLTLSLDQVQEVTWYSDFPLECQNCLSIQIRPKKSGDLMVNYLDLHGCYWTDTISLNVTMGHDVFPALINTITPNGDGVNDYLSFEQWGKVNQLGLQVYNETGQRLYYAEHYQNDWNGTDQGKALPEGVYFYILTFEHQGKIIQLDSDLTILRE